MSQYGTQPDPAKMWGLMGSAGADGGGVTPLVPSTPSVPQKPLSSPYNGLPGPGYRTVNGNRTSANQNSSHHSLHHWSSGIRLPTAPQGAWDQFRPSGQHSTAYLNSPPLPTSITPQAGIQPQQQQQAQQHLQQASSGWYPGAGIPTQKLPHRPYPGIHIMQEEHQNSLQQQETAITNPIPAYLNPFSSSPVSAQDMTMLAAAAAAQSRAETATSVPAQTQVYLPTPQSAPPASVVSSPLGEFLPPPSAAPRINAYSPATSSLELDVLRNLHQQTPGQSLQPLLAQAQGQPSPQKLPRQFWSPPAGQLPSLMGSFPTSSLGSPTSGRGSMTAVKSEMPFSPAQSQQQEDLVHSTTGGSAGCGLLAVRQPVTPTGYGMTTITGRSSQQSSGGEVGSPGCRRNGLSPSQRVSNCAQDVTTTVPTTVSCSMSSPQYQQISPAISTTSEQATTATGSEVSEGLSPGKAGGGRSQSGPTVVVTTSCAQVSSRTQGLNSPTSLPRGQSSSSSAAQTPASAPGTPTSLGSSSDSTSRLCVDFSGSSSNGISGLKTTAEDSAAGSVCGGVIMAPKVEPGAETVTQAQFFDNPNKAKSTLTPDQEGNFPESTFEGNTNGKADSIEEVNNLGAENQSQKEKVEQSQSARSPQGENAFKQGLIRTKSERPDVYDFQPEGEEGDQEPTSRSPPPTLESERSPQENGNDGEDALMMEPDDDGSGKPLVVDTELHEPITPEELSPEASNNSLPPGYLGPEAAEMNRKASLLLERKIQSEGGQGVLLSGAFVPSVTSVTRPPGLRPPLGFPLISPSQPLSANSSLKISPAGNVSSSAGGQSTYTCPICGFTSTSKFHFNSHMNTHTDHQCSMCDYTARTEGRLKRHMKEFHSPAEQMAAGVTPSGELMDTLPSSSGEGRGTPSALEQMQQALARSQEVFAQHQLNPESGGSGSDTGTPPKDGERKQSTSHKPKHYRCKQCTHMSTSKEESWQHARSHIKPDKLLSCPQCEFVTEYKHHLEYHLRNHFGSKPFRCNKCNYSCVNKSMLNSHMKSHSSFYQFRCRDCTYATKYCHSLKLHLRKYGHHPANVDLPDGTSLDTTAIDVYGNRRGPRPKKSDSASPPFVSPLTVTAAGSMFPSSEPSPVTPNPVLTGGLPSLVPPNILEALRFQQNLGAMAKSIATLGAQLPTVQSDAAGADNAARAPESASGASTANQKCQMCGYRSTSQQDFVQHVFMHKLETVNLYSSAAASTAAAAALLGQSANAGPGSQSAEGSEEHSPSAVGRMSPSVTGEGSQASSGSPISGSKGSGDEGSGGAGGEQPPGGSSRRKGKAYKLDRIALRLQQAGRMSPSPSSGGQEDPEVMDVQAQEQEEHVEQSELGMETVESVVQNVIRAQPQSLVPSKSSGSGTSGSGEGGTTTTPTTTTATSAQSGPGAAHTLLEALKGAMENRQREGTPGEEKSEGSGRKEIDWQCAFKCDHCQIAFMNEVMYHIHMGYHGYDNPFRCNRCGELCKDSLGMFMHIAQAKH